MSKYPVITKRYDTDHEEIENRYGRVITKRYGTDHEEIEDRYGRMITKRYGTDHEEIEDRYSGYGLVITDCHGCYDLMLMTIWRSESEILASDDTSWPSWKLTFFRYHLKR